MPISIQSTVEGVYGHIPYRFAAAFGDPVSLRRRGGARRRSPNHGSLLIETQLRRQRNRVADAIADAGEMVGDALSALGE